jgi:para-nitrobenzyl esterase
VSKRNGAFKAVRASLSVAVFVVVGFLPTHIGMAQAASNTLVVQTSTGQLNGIVRVTGGAEFLGIPYAQPPVGERRWREPLPAKAWSGVREARAFGAPCSQPFLGDWNKHEAENGKEDCLFLNVISPVWPVKEKLPVMFWIHGGANMGGTASSALYKDGTLPQHGVLLVTVNYRLGVFGFFAHSALTAESPHHASGNYGLMDQILALRWVRENIAKFGGDPQNITVFGQSAGSMDLGMLMTSQAKDLFQKAIAESGSPVSPSIPTLADAEHAGEELAAGWKAPACDAGIKKLRELSAQELLTAIEKLDLPQGPRLGPDVDGWVLPRLPGAVFAHGEESAIPLLFGTTTREFGMTATADGLRKIIDKLAGEFAPQAMAAYGLTGDGEGTIDPLYGSVADQWAADVAFRCPATTQGAWHTAAHHPTYEYEFDHAIPGQEAQGAVHSSDLPYVFGYFPKEGNIAGNFGETDFKLADLIATYWTNFARTGNPNSSSVPKWPLFGEAQALIQFTQDGSVVKAAGLRAAQCTVYREVVAERMKQLK